MNKRLLRPGYAGMLTLREAKWLKTQLEGNKGLRRRWKMGRRKHPPLTLIAEKAFPENPQAARSYIRRQQNRTRVA